jgi:hypothetical protein
MGLRYVEASKFPRMLKEYLVLSEGGVKEDLNAGLKEISRGGEGLE